MAQIPSLAALSNMALLKNSPSSANMANYDDIFDGPTNGHVPSAWEQYSGDQNADMAETAMGAGPSIDAFRHAADAARLEKASDTAADEADFFAHGMDRGMAHANVQNQVGDVLSEGAARRRTLPFAAQAQAEDAQRQQELAATRYLMPAQVKAQGDLGAAGIAAQGRVGAVTAHESGTSMRGFYNAINEYIAKTGHVPTADDLAQMKSMFGAQ